MEQPTRRYKNFWPLERNYWPQHQIYVAFKAPDKVTIVHQRVSEADIQTKDIVSEEEFDFTALGVSQLTFGIKIQPYEDGFR